MTDTSAIEPLIKITRIKKNWVRFYLSPRFSKRYVRQPFTLTYPPDIDLEKLPPSVVSIPLIANVIAAIWFSGERYSIDEIDEGLYYSLQKIKEFFRRFFYNTAWEGELVPKRIVKHTIPKTSLRSASMFSGGLDSTATVFRHLDEKPMLISLNEPHKAAAGFAAKYHLELNEISTNYHSFLKLTLLNKASIDITKWFWDTSMGLSWIGMTSPLLYARGIPVLYIPSGFTWRHFLFPDGQTMRQPASPLIDNNLAPMGLRVYHDDFSMTRTDKIKFISTFCVERAIPKPQLIVCTYHQRSNTSYSPCNKCFKCYITMLDILAIGERLQDYGFTLSEKEFISRFKLYIDGLKMRRGGTYVSLLDTQRYIKQNLRNLPKRYRPFYDWFIAINLWERVETASNRPLRTTPFNWMDYDDLYPDVKNFTE